MHTSHFLKLVLFGAVAMIFASCSKSNTQGKLIPKEAAIVIRMDGKSLSSKLPWEEIKQNPLFVEMGNDSTLPAALKSILDNPENAGIDIKTDCMFFAIKDSIGGYIAFEGKIKDEAKFKTFNQEITNNGASSEAGGVQFISKSPVCVGWNKETFVYVFDAPQFSQMDELSRRMMRDSIDIRSRSARDIGATCKSIFALAESNSLAKDEKFTHLMKAAGDMQFWVNTEELSKGSPTSGALAAVNLQNFYKGYVTTGTVNFDNGKMLVNATTYASDEMLKLFKKYRGGKVKEDMIKRMPGKDVVAVMALNFQPEAIRDLIKMTGLDGLINIGVQKIGFTVDDFIKANKGDIFFGLSDLTMKPDTTTFKFKDQEKNISISPKPQFNFIFATSIGDKESFNKLVNAGKSIGNGVYSDSSKSPFSFNSNGTYFALSNNKQNVDQYLGGTSSDFDFIKKISGEPFGGYLNIQSLLKSFQNEAVKDSTAKIAYDATLQMWDNVFWKGGNYSDGGIQQTVEINLIDKSTNSLKQLNQYAAKLSQLYKAHRKKQAEMAAFEDVQFPDTSRLTAPVKTK
ncbi:MAG: hypothetical protein JWP81_4907 [Ferruginibacter sp.]|nr:hypothetical protein [Ferruginibacter sp.]